MDDVIAFIGMVIIIAALALLCCPSSSEESQNRNTPHDGQRSVMECRTVNIQRPRAQPDLEWTGLEYSLNVLQGPRVLSQTRMPRYRNGRIVLYHYTTHYGARGIRRDGLIKSSDNNTQQQHRRFGEGVYFTAYSPYDLEPDQLALNCFTNRGTVVTSRGIYSRTRYVVEIEFYPSEVERIYVFNRDVYIFRGTIYLREYVGRYRIYKNPRRPYDMK